MPPVSTLMEDDLFPETTVTRTAKPNAVSKAHQRSLSQYMTPEWAAELIVDTFFADLTRSDVVLEPTCGRGAFLGAIPTRVNAFGVEIDPILAEVARHRTGRSVITGDIRSAELHVTPTVVVGNPPFVADFFDALLDRCFAVLPFEGRAGFVIPAYFCQTSSRVGRWHKRWSISQSLIPRNLWTGLETPLLFAMFTKTTVRKLFGFALYLETNEVKKMATRYQSLLTEGGGSGVWSELVDRAIDECGGRASLETLYRCVMPKAPPSNRFPREKIRQTLARGSRVGRYQRVGTTSWALAKPPAPRAFAWVDGKSRSTATSLAC